MTNQKTPVQGGVTEEQIEAAATAKYGSPPDPSLEWKGWATERERIAVREGFKQGLASASAHPADEHHDAEEREAESENHAATVTGDREKLISEAREAFDAAGHMPQGTMDHESQWLPFARLYNVTERMIDALAAPVEVDEAKLAELALRFCTCSHWLEVHLYRECLEEHCACTDFDPVLRGEGR